MKFPDELPEHLWRFPTGAARKKLAARFDIALNKDDQDWEWTNSRVGQLPEYLVAYASGELDDDERFTLMEMMIQCVEDELDRVHYSQVLRILEENVELHFYSVWYWSCIGSDMDEAWDIAPAMRDILWRRRDLWQ